MRGVYVGDDTSYTNVGFRRVRPAGRLRRPRLVLVDGMPTNDDYVGSSYVGYDARADIDDVQRIEVVRGPGSALYGTGAFFGVINLVTRDRDAPTHGEIATSTADSSVGRARATAQVRLSNDAGGWVSVAGAHDRAATTSSRSTPPTRRPAARPAASTASTPAPSTAASGTRPSPCSGFTRRARRRCPRGSSRRFR